jgi:hypothetical protein
MFDYLVTTVMCVAGLAMFCGLIVGFTKMIDLFLNQLDDRDPWK